MRPNFVNGELADHGIDVAAQHALDDLRVLDLPEDVPFVPDLAQPLDVLHLKGLELLLALLGVDVDPLLDQRPVAASKFSRVFQ